MNSAHHRTGRSSARATRAASCTRASRLGAALLAWLLCAPPVRADRDTSTLEPTSQERTSQTQREGVFLPNTAAPGLAQRAAAAFGSAGYDAARSSVVMNLLGEIHVCGPLDLRLGLNYVPNVESGAARAEPQFGLRLRLLSQAEQGIDAAAMLSYRLDRFTSDEGLVQAMFIVGRHFDRASLFANLGYGQDPEGDDREGEAALALLYALSQVLQIGFETHARFDLFSTDPRRAQRHDAAAETASGPMLHYVMGPCVVLAQVGLSTLIGTHQARLGALALAGVGATY
jgi:hypothetical protein